MRALKVCHIGFDSSEQQGLRHLLEEVCLQAEVLFHSSDEGSKIRQLPDCDIILLRHKSSEDWVEQFLQMRVMRHIFQPTVVVVDEFLPQTVLHLSNLGAERVIPSEYVRDLLPECMKFYFPELCRGFAKRIGENNRLYAFEGLSGLARVLRTEKTGLVFVERLLDTLEAMVVVLSVEGQIVFLNRTAEEISGYGLSEVAGRNFADLFLKPEEKAGVLQVFQNLKNGNFPGQHQNSWLTREGKEIRIEWSNTGLINENGEVIYIVALGLNITAAYHQDQALRALEERFAKVFNTALIGIAILSRPDGRVIQANEAMAQILGLHEEKLPGKSLVELSLIKNDSAFHEAVDRVTRQSVPFYLETPVLTTQEPSRYIQLSLDQFDLAEESGLLLLVQDITERVKAEEGFSRLNMELERRVQAAVAEQDAINRELRIEISFRQAIESSSQRLTQIMWEMPDIVAITNLEGKLQYLNKTGRQILGLNEIDSVNHLSVYDFYQPNYQKFILEEILPYVLKNGSWKGETSLVFPDGKIIPISQVILSHLNEQGEGLFFSSIARDISEEKEYDEKLRLSYEREKRLGEMRSNLFSMTSHQFRTPLSTILSSAELLEHYGEVWKQDKRILHTRRIQDAVRRMDKLLSDILLLSQVQSQAKMKLVEIDVVAFCRRIMDEVVLNEKGQHTFEFQAASSHIAAWMDEEILQRILDNLLSNAIKYSSAGTLVRIEVWSESEMVHLQVSDQGIGIAENDIQHLFEPFYRGMNVADKAGNGLGLMIVKKSLELIPGTIEVFSKVGEGTTVRVQFPQGKVNLGL